MAETKRLLTLLTISALLFTSCVGEGGSGRKTRFSDNSSIDSTGGTSGRIGNNSGSARDVNKC